MILQQDLMLHNRASLEHHVFRGLKKAALEIIGLTVIVSIDAIAKML